MRSQSAMEYLMTYGWAILVIAVILGVLFQLGVFSTASFAPKAKAGQCQVQVVGSGSSTTHQLAGLCSPELPQFVAVFDGGSSNVVVNNPINIGPARITVSAWVYPTLLTGSRREVVGNDNTPHDSFFMSLNANGNAEGDFWINNGGWVGPVVSQNNAFPLDTWTFITGVYDGSQLTLYVNGQLAGGPCCSTSGSLTQPPGSISIGSDTSSQWFQGDIANVQIYNTSLSAAEILALYQEGIGGAPVRPENITEWWPLNGNTNDYGGNNQNGQNMGTGFSGTWADTYSGPT